MLLPHFGCAGQVQLEKIKTVPQITTLTLPASGSKRPQPLTVPVNDDLLKTANASSPCVPSKPELVEAFLAALR
eukprot:COSAG05_NODE_6862_length_891_cov_1.237374_1_plen_73_part_10